MGSEYGGYMAYTTSRGNVIKKKISDIFNSNFAWSMNKQQQEKIYYNVISTCMQHL